MYIESMYTKVSLQNLESGSSQKSLLLCVYELGCRQLVVSCPYSLQFQSPHIVFLSLPSNYSTSTNEWLVSSGINCRTVIKRLYLFPSGKVVTSLHSLPLSITHFNLCVYTVPFAPASQLLTLTPTNAARWVPVIDTLQDFFTPTVLSQLEMEQICQAMCSSLAVSI